MYKFIEITCPNCNHQFVWLEHTYKGTNYKLYRRRGHDELLESTICPKCNTEMVVLKNSHNGISIEDDLIEVAGTVRGI